MMVGLTAMFACQGATTPQLTLVGEVGTGDAALLVAVLAALVVFVLSVLCGGGADAPPLVSKLLIAAS